MSKLIIIPLFILISLHANAQGLERLFRDFKEPKSITYGMNNRRYSILDDPSTIYSGYVGVKYGSRLKHVISVNSTVLWVGQATDNGAANPLETHMNFVGFSEEFMFFNWRKFSFSTYLHIGVGRAFFRPIGIEASPVDRITVFPLVGGIHGSYALNTWLDVRIGAGYQYVINKPNIPLSGVYYKLGLGVNLKTLMSKIRSLKGIKFSLPGTY